jgi:hypothetical protein
MGFLGWAWSTSTQQERLARVAEMRQSSERLATLAEQETAAGDVSNGILLALHALPTSPDHDWPFLHRAAQTLVDSRLALREKVVLRRGDSRVLTAAARFWDLARGGEPLVLGGPEDNAVFAAFSS